MKTNDAERDEVIDVGLRAHDPASGFNTDHGRLARIASRSPWSRRRRVPWQGWVTLAVAASAALALGLPAITTGLSGIEESQTQPGSSQTPEIGATDDPQPQAEEPNWAGLGVPDFPEYLAATFPDGLPFPESAPREQFEHWLVNLFIDQDPSYIEEDYEAGLGFTYEFDVRCLWVQDWLAADSTGDQPRSDAAASVIRDSLDWPLLGPNGGGVPEHFERLSDAISAGDRDGAVLELGGDCDFDVNS